MTRVSEGCGPARKCGYEHIFFDDPAPCVLLSSEWPGEKDGRMLLEAVRRSFEEAEWMHRTVTMDRDGWCRYHLPAETDRKRFWTAANLPAGTGQEEGVLRMQKWPFHLGTGENMHVGLQKLPTGVRLYLGVHHLFMDGMSLLHFFDRVIEHRKNLAFYLTAKEREGAFENTSLPRTAAEGSPSAAMPFSAASSAATSFPEPSFSKKIFSGIAASGYIVLTEDETKQLAGLCRENGCTVTGWFAAVLFTLEEVKRIRIPVRLGEGHLSGNHTGLVDLLRPREPAGSEKTAEAASGFWRTAAECTAQLKRKAGDKQLRRNLEMVQRIPSRELSQAVRSLSRPEEKTPYSALAGMLCLAPPNLIVLSNPGRRREDPSDRGWVEKVIFYPGVKPWQKMAVGVLTMNGQMTISTQKARDYGDH